MTLTFWLAVLLTLLLNIEAINLAHGGGEQNEESADNSDAQSGDSEEPETDSTTKSFSNTTQGVTERRDAAEERKKDWESMKRPWLGELMKNQNFLIDTAKGFGMTNKTQDELKMSYVKLENQIRNKYEGSVKKELAAVKFLGPPGPPPTDAEQFAKLTTVTKVFTTGGPTFFKQLKEGDGAAAASTVCGMISGVAAVIPNPIGMVTSFIFSIASFFINFGAKKAAVSKKNPYTEIYKKIDWAVEKITGAQRKIELARMKAGMAMAEDISERFLSLGGERFTLDEFQNWMMSNNVPSMGCFVDPMAIVQSYMETMRAEVFEDGTGKVLTTLYVKIAIVRDIVLTAVNLLFPLNTIETPAPTPGEPEEPEEPDEAELKDFCSLKRLRASYQDSLNRQKKKTFDYLLQFHRPNINSLMQLRYNNWYYSENDEDVEIVRTYLEGLSYVADDGGVRLMQRVLIHDEVLRKARCSFLYEDKALTRSLGGWAEERPYGFTLDFTHAASGVDSTQRYFTFLPAGSYTYSRPKGQKKDFTVTRGFARIKFHDESIEDFGDWHDVVDISDRGYFVTLYDDRKSDGALGRLNVLTNGYEIEKKDKDNKNERKTFFLEKDDGHKYKEFKILLTNSDNEEESDDELQILVMSAKSPTGEAGYLGRNTLEIFRDPRTGTFLLYTKAYTLKILNLAEVKEHLRNTFDELGEHGEETKVELGNSFGSVNEALHYCQLVGRCAQQISE